MLWWFADQALQTLPPPADGFLSLIGDSTLKGKRGPKHPVAQNTRLSHQHPYVFGFRLVLLMAQWGVYRIPVDFALLRRKDDTAYQTENTLFRQMLRDFQPPPWCQEVVVVADAAYASRPNMALIQELGYWYVVALPRTWKFTTGKALKALVTYLPRWWYARICIPTLTGQRRRTFWVYAKRVRLRHLGGVTVVLSTCRRHDGPKQTKILVTNLPETVSARQMVAIYRRRWWVEVCQTHPIKMPRCPLRLFRQTLSHPRGGFNREHVMDVNRFSRDDDFADQALGDRLTCFKRELFTVMAQSLPKGLGMVNDLLPMNALLLSLRSLPTLPLNLLPLGREFLTPHVQLTQVESLGLRGIKPALVLTLDPLLALEQLRELCFKRGEVLLCGFRPRLMPLRDHVWMAQQLTQRLPDHRIEPISTHTLGVALHRAANRQRRVPFALVVEILVFFADAQLPDAYHPQPARSTCDERPQHIPP